jgi:hypothetical protein
VESVAQLVIWHANHFINHWNMFTMHEGCAAAAAAADGDDDEDDSDDVLLNFTYS